MVKIFIMEYRATGGNVVPLLKVNHDPETWMFSMEDYKSVTNEKLKDEERTYIYHNFDHMPSKEDLKAFVEQYYNTCIEDEIINGFKYEYNPVYLSLENQLNYQSIYNRILRGKMTYPVELKFGDAYVSFENESQFEKFYLAMREYIDVTVEKGWKLKRSFDYEKYDKDYSGADS
jgi:hypothetical protein